MKMFIGKIAERDCFMEHISYSCPSLRLYGYSTDLQLARAIYRKLGKPFNYGVAMANVIGRHKQTSVVA